MEPQRQAEPTRILLLGATGYIGGSVLTSLLDQSLDIKHDLTVTALVRQAYQVSILKDAGVEAEVFGGLDEVEVIKKAAREVDVVIAAASARHEGAARACIQGLGERKRATGRETHYIHTSGASNIADWPVTRKRVSEKTYDDVEDNLFEIERQLEEQDAGMSPVRTVDQIVVEEGEKAGVRTYIIIPPLIFGPGTGSFTLGFGQVHMLVQASLKRKQAVMIGTGSGIWSRIHIQDLCTLFTSLITSALSSSSKLPYGKKGYYFAENGSSSWKSIAEKTGEVGKKLGIFESGEVGELSLEDAAEEFYEGSLRDAEAVLGSSARIKSSLARQALSWSPTRGEADFMEEIEDVVTSMIEQAQEE